MAAWKLSSEGGERVDLGYPKCVSCEQTVFPTEAHLYVVGEEGECYLIERKLPEATEGGGDEKQGVLEETQGADVQGDT